MEFTAKLFGKQWVDDVIREPESKHSLALWFRKEQDNPVIRYVDAMAEFILKSGSVKCDAAQLANKLRSDFNETLSEMGCAVSLAKKGLTVTMEPFFPKRGPDLVGVGEHEYFIENRKV